MKKIVVLLVFLNSKYHYERVTTDNLPIENKIALFYLLWRYNVQYHREERNDEAIC